MRNPALQTQASLAPRSRPALSILLVDADPEFSRSLEAQARKMDIKVVCCRTLRELKSTAFSGRFDLAVIETDLNSVRRGLSGGTLARRLRIPTILVSGFRAFDVADWGATNSIKRFLSKDLGPETILKEALRLHERNPY